jgi:hypothetical protein
MDTGNFAGFIGFESNIVRPGKAEGTRTRPMNRDGGTGQGKRLWRHAGICAYTCFGNFHVKDSAKIQRRDGKNGGNA